MGDSALGEVVQELYTNILKKPVRVGANASNQCCFHTSNREIGSSVALYPYLHMVRH